MSLEFLSGLLLALTVLGLLGFIAKELFWDAPPEDPSAEPRDTAVRRRKREAKPVNEHLVGASGEVVASSDDEERPMKVRLGLELWPARAASSHEIRFPVGTQIEVTAVQGPVVIVRSPTERGSSETSAESAS